MILEQAVWNINNGLGGVIFSDTNMDFISYTLAIWRHFFVNGSIGTFKNEFF